MYCFQVIEVQGAGVQPRSTSWRTHWGLIQQPLTTKRCRTCEEHRRSLARGTDRAPYPTEYGSGGPQLLLAENGCHIFLNLSGRWTRGSYLIKCCTPCTFLSIRKPFPSGQPSTLQSRSLTWMAMLRVNSHLKCCFLKTGKGFAIVRRFVFPNWGSFSNTNHESTCFKLVFIASHCL